MNAYKTWGMLTDFTLRRKSISNLRLARLARKGKKAYTSRPLSWWIEQAGAGDWVAMETLLQQSQPLIIRLSQQYVNQGLNLKELYLHARIGFIKAIHRMHPLSEFSFQTHAIWWMRQSVLKALEEHAKIQEIRMGYMHRLQKVSSDMQRLEAYKEQPYPTDEDLDFISQQMEQMILQVRRGMGRSPGDHPRAA